MTLHAFFIYCGVYAVAIATPGPGVVAIIGRAVKTGFRSAVPAVCGTVVGDWLLMSVSVFGLAAAAQALGGLFQAVKLLGAAYLAFLGYKYWTTADDPPTGGQTEDDPRRTCMSQLALTLGNPKAIAFFVALLPNVIDLKHLDVVPYLELSSAALVLIPAVELSYAALAARLQGALASATAKRRLSRRAAVLVTGAAVAVD